MASPNLTPTCDYPRVLVTGFPAGSTEIALKALFDQRVVGRMLHVELLDIPGKVPSAIITFNGSEGMSEMMGQEIGIASSELKLRQLFTEETHFTLKNLDSELNDKVPQLVMKWKLNCRESPSGLTVSGHCDRVKQFRDELESLAKDLIPSAISFPDPSNSPAIENISYPKLSSDHSESDLGPLASVADPHPIDPFSHVNTEGLKTCTQTGLSCDALILLDTLPDKEIPGVHYDISSGTVLIAAKTERELENLTWRFQDAYQSITAPKKMKTTSIQPPHKISDTQTKSLIEKFKSKYNQCAFRYFEGAVRIVSTSSRQFDQVVKLFKEELKLHKGASASSSCGSTKEVITLPHGRTLTLKKGNIVEERVDVIVNAANSRLSHGGGVAKAIDDASYGAVQRYSDSLVYQYGEVRVGNVAVTYSGGELACRYVFHAVGPTSREHNSGQLLVRLTTNILQEAEHYVVQSIAIPAISSGLFGVSKQLVAESIISAILSYKFKSSAPTLSDIRIVIIDDPTYQCFAQHMRQRRARQLPHTVSPAPASSPSSLPSPRGPSPTAAPPGAENRPPATAAGGQPTLPESKSVGTGEHHPPSLSSPPGLTKQHSYPGTGPITSSTGGDRGGSLPPDNSSEVQLPPSDDESAGDGDGSQGAGAERQPSSEGDTPAASSSSTVSTSTASPPTNTTSSHSTMAGETSTVTTTSTGASYSTAVTGGQGTSVDPLGAVQTTQHSMPAHVSAAHHAATNSHGTKPKTGAAAHQHGHGERGKGHRDQPGKKNHSTKTGSTAEGKGKGHHSKAGPTAKDNECPICLDDFKTPVITKCGHTFCHACLQRSVQHNAYCPTCRKAIRKVEGNQPRGGTMFSKVIHQKLPGYYGCNTIQIDYCIPSGVQTQGHPNPGAYYTGTSRTAYLPNNLEGNEVLKLLKKAFDARLIFTVGTSITSGQRNVVVWNDIHHKTSISGGPYGYPDPGYLGRVKEDLAAKGIYPDSSTV